MIDFELRIRYLKVCRPAGASNQLTAKPYILGESLCY